MRPPSPSSALPAQGFDEAVPQGISGRASYFQVCLVFRSEPRVIPAFFNRLGFGPPPGFTRASACRWLDHLASGLWHATGRTCVRHSPCSDSVSLRLRDSHPLASLHTITRRLILQKARHHPIARTLTCCGSTVSGSLSLPSPGFFSPFPHGTSALSVAPRV